MSDCQVASKIVERLPASPLASGSDIARILPKLKLWLEERREQRQRARKMVSYATRTNLCTQNRPATPSATPKLVPSSCCVDMVTPSLRPL